ncbi:MAG: gluconate 2-dehydrogenase subunit 3 family protein [Pseudomonadota bacterium]|nr:gluconate 2-dehydrogenase subunit 3 family protein [Pseudomonadota bacterium]
MIDLNNDHHDREHDHDPSHDSHARREFLKQTAVASMILGAGIPMATPVAAGPLKALSDHEALSVLMMARTLFPHDFLADSYYMNIVNSIDAKAAGDAKAKTLLQSGVQTLDSYGGKFVQMDEHSRTSILQSLEKTKTDFFGMVYSETVGGLYGNQEIWKILGFEGSSTEKGGYINRGFNDINWLPKS